MKEDSVKVSIITPSYNQGQFVEATILSVLNQTYQNIEYIVVDGGSTDNTMDIIEKYRDQIDIVIHEKDKGQSDAINKGFRLSTGELAGWINSDDVLYPECVENLVHSWQAHSDAAVFYCPKLDYVDKSGSLLYSVSRWITGRDYLLKVNYDINQPTSFYNKKILEQVGYLDERIECCMDLDLWLRLLKYGTIIPFSDRPQGAIRRWEETKTATKVDDFLKEIRHTLRRNGIQWNHLVWKTYFQQWQFYIKRVLLKLN